MSCTIDLTPTHENGLLSFFWSQSVTKLHPGYGNSKQKKKKRSQLMNPRSNGDSVLSDELSRKQLT